MAAVTGCEACGAEPERIVGGWVLSHRPGCAEPLRAEVEQCVRAADAAERRYLAALAAVRRARTEERLASAAVTSAHERLEAAEDRLAERTGA